MSHARPLVAAQHPDATTRNASGTWAFSTLGTALLAQHQANETLRTAPPEVMHRRVNGVTVINRRSR